MATDINGPEEVSRPNLKKRSVVFDAITGIAVGAVLSAAVITVITGSIAIEKLFSKTGANIAFKDLIKQKSGEIKNYIKTGGAVSGLIFAGMSAEKNSVLNHTKPYIEKLEKQRDILIGQTGNAK